MKKVINGKEYEFIEGDCEDCVFQLHPGCGSPIELDECIYLNDKNIWKEVKGESSSKDV